MNTTVDGRDDLPAFVGLAPHVLPHAFADLRTHQLNLVLNIIGVAQMRAAAPRRKKREAPRDEHVVLPVFWLNAVTGKGYNSTKERVLDVADLRLGDGEPLLDVEWYRGEFDITVAASYCYPPTFVRVPLPLPVGDKLVAQTWLSLWTALHHGRKQPIQLRRSLSAGQLAQLNQHLKSLRNSWQLRDHGIRVPLRVEQQTIGDVHYLGFTMPPIE
jgi:hypothetical protein